MNYFSLEVSFSMHAPIMFPVFSPQTQHTVQQSSTRQEDCFLSPFVRAGRGPGRQSIYCAVSPTHPFSQVSDPDRSGTQCRYSCTTGARRRMLLLAVICAAVLGVTAQSPILISELEWCLYNANIILMHNLHNLNENLHV